MARGRKGKRAQEDKIRLPHFDEKAFLGLERRAAMLLGIAVGLGALVAALGSAIAGATGGDTRLGTALGILLSSTIAPIAQLMGFRLSKPQAADFGNKEKKRDIEDRLQGPVIVGPKGRTYLPVTKLLGAYITYLLVFLAVFLLLINPPLADFQKPQVTDRTTPDQLADGDARILFSVTDNGELDTVRLQVTDPDGGALSTSLIKLDDSTYQYELPTNASPGAYIYVIEASDTGGLTSELQGRLTLEQPPPPDPEFDPDRLRLTVLGSPHPSLVTYAYDVNEEDGDWWTDPAVEERKLKLKNGSGTLSAKGIPGGTHDVSICLWYEGAGGPKCKTYSVVI